jgi:hypothetical protein
LNDPSEIAHAHALIHEVINERLTVATHPASRELLVRSLNAIDPHDGMYQYFVFSFCEAADLLGQWRAYSSRGGGYAVGFDTRVVEGATDPSPALTLRKVIYDHGLQRDLIGTTIDHTLRKLEQVTGDSEIEKVSGTIAMFVSFLRDHFSEFHFSFKNRAFEEEREWRLIVQAGVAARDALLRDLRFRPVNGITVPYLSVQLSASAGPTAGKLPITRLVYGPTIDSRQAQHALRLLLDKHGYSFVTIASSQVPLRA